MFLLRPRRAVCHVVILTIILLGYPAVTSAGDEVILSPVAQGRYLPGNFAQEGWISVGQGQAGWFSFLISDLLGERACALKLSFTQLDTSNAPYFPLTISIYDVSTDESRLFLDYIPMTPEGDQIAEDLHTGGIFGTFLAQAELHGSRYEVDLNELGVLDFQRRLDLGNQYFSIGLAHENFYAVGYFSPAYANLHVTVNCVLPVALDIKPGSCPNSVNIKSKGVIPVAILTTSVANGDPWDFDATSVDVASLAFGPAGAAIVHRDGHLEDIDGDGDIDLVAHFAVQETGFECGDDSMTLTGETLDGIALVGTDSIRVRGCR